MLQRYMNSCVKNKYVPFLFLFLHTNYAENRYGYARALAKLSREKAAFPDMSHETLNSAFPGRSQGMIQVLSTADGQLNRLNQSGLK